MRILLLVVLQFIAGYFVYGQSIPEGYLLQYQQDFSKSLSLQEFSITRPWASGISQQGKNGFLRFNRSDTISIFPSNMAILKNKAFGDFVLEADVLPVKDTAEMQDACLFLGIRDSSKYYFIQLAHHDSIDKGIYLVKDSVVTRLTGENENQYEWKEKTHKIRLERNIVRRTIAVYVNQEPMLLAKDYELVMGWVGFGSFSGQARFDNIRIWAPTLITDEQLKEMYGK